MAMTEPLVIPRRDYGRALAKADTPLAPTLSIVGLGCSSFSTFFWTEEEELAAAAAAATTTSSSSSAEDDGSTSSTGGMFTPDTLRRDHPKVQEWIAAIHHAVTKCAINLLDTAPWYGHGTSEIVVGWALQDLLASERPDHPSSSTTGRPVVRREDIVINTKVGRYEADRKLQFDFSRGATISSVQRSLKRLQCDYIDVLQLHDPEFAPTLEVLMREAVPAMIECRARGWCKALGMTGYPLEVQYQLLQRTYQDYGGKTDVWDQTLTYGHFNLHDSSLVHRPILRKGPNKDITDIEYPSFAAYCEDHSVGLLAAAPLSMGLLTCNQLPVWHPARDSDLAVACQQAVAICQDHGVSIASLAILYALSHPQIPCTILGMKNVTEVEQAAAVARRFDKIDWNATRSQNEILQQVLTEPEAAAYKAISDRESGPFAALWNGYGDETDDGVKGGSVPPYQWDGIQGVYSFWKAIEGTTYEEWQLRAL